METPDLIIGSSVHPLTPLIGLKKAKKAGSLFYFEERDLWPQTFIDFGILGRRNIISIILYKVEKYLYNNSDKVIFLFDKAHEYAYTRGLPKEKSIYLPNGYSAERVTNLVKSEELEGIISRYSDKKLCVYTGSLGKANHMMPLLKLAYSMRHEEDYHFLIIGSGPFKSSLVKFAKEKKLITYHFIIQFQRSKYLTY